MLQSVSAHLMEERRPSLRVRRDSARRETSIVYESLLPPGTDPNFLSAPAHWHGTLITENFQPEQARPDENPIGWAIFNPLPIRLPTIRPRGRTVVGKFGSFLKWGKLCFWVIGWLKKHWHQIASSFASNCPS